MIPVPQLIIYAIISLFFPAIPKIPSVASVSIEVEPSPSVTPSPTANPTPTQAATAKPTNSSSQNSFASSNTTNIVNSTKVFVSGKENSTSSGNSLDYQYPGSKILSSSGAEVSFEISDDPKKVTSWYEEKLRSENFSAKSFSKTSSNGNVLNNLVAASGDQKVSVEITKKSDSSEVEIKVSISAS